MARQDVLQDFLTPSGGMVFISRWQEVSSLVAFGNALQTIPAVISFNSRGLGFGQAHGSAARLFVQLMFNFETIFNAEILLL